MASSKIVDLNFTNLTNDQFEVILIELTTMIANMYFNTDYTTHNIYNYIIFKDFDRTNLDVSNLMLNP